MARLSYSEYLEQVFGPGKVQKISINAGMSCPNRDGTIGINGCIYCNNESFTPQYCISSKSVSQQLSEGRRFFARKYPTMRYLAYFQSFTNTFLPINQLRDLYLEALAQPGVVGVVIGTRPDTLPDDVVSLLADINCKSPVILEFGAESSNNATLERINRGHTWQQTVDAVQRATAVGLRCGLHLIAGLPGETRAQSLKSIKDAASLPIDTIKLHQLQIIRNTPLHKLWLDNPEIVKPFTLEEYIDFCHKAQSLIPENIVIERYLAQAPPQMVVAPKWGIKNYQFVDMLNKR